MALAHDTPVKKPDLAVFHRWNTTTMAYNGPHPRFTLHRFIQTNGYVQKSSLKTLSPPWKMSTHSMPFGSAGCVVEARLTRSH
jgi:hypothetical protein